MLSKPSVTQLPPRYWILFAVLFWPCRPGSEVALGFWNAGFLPFCCHFGFCRKWSKLLNWDGIKLTLKFWEDFVLWLLHFVLKGVPQKQKIVTTPAIMCVCLFLNTFSGEGFVDMSYSFFACYLSTGCQLRFMQRDMQKPRSCRCCIIKRDEWVTRVSRKLQIQLMTSQVLWKCTAASQHFCCTNPLQALHILCVLS